MILIVAWRYIYRSADALMGYLKIHYIVSLQVSKDFENIFASINCNLIFVLWNVVLIYLYLEVTTYCLNVVLSFFVSK